MGERITKDDIIKSLLDKSFLQSAGATSLSDVAGRLNIKKASLYNHFNGREAIVSGAMSSCAEYIEAINFIPQDLEGVTTKYPVETVLKGIINRYFKMHEKSPLFQIYTFVESQKYFDQRAAKVVKDEYNKFVEQTTLVFSSLAQKNKINLKSQNPVDLARWFSGASKIFLDMYLLERKKIVMENPESGDGELFTLPPDETGTLEKVNAYIDEFCNLIK